MRSLLALLLAMSIAVLAACGSDDSGSSSAAELAPAGAAMYGEFTLKPEGEQKAAIDSVLAKFPGGENATKRLHELIQEGLKDSDAPIDYEKDVEPWLGDDGAFFVSSFVPGTKTSGAAMIASEDDDAARDALDKAFGGEAEEQSYKDVDMLVDTRDDSAAAVVDGYVVAGTVRGVKAVIDTSDGGSPLEDDETYKNEVSEAPEDRLGLLYVNSPKLLDVAQRQAQGVPLPGSFRDALKEPYVMTLDVDEDGPVFEANVPESLAKSVPFFGPAAGALAEDMPGDSWFVMAQPELGSLADYYLEAFGEAMGNRQMLEQQFKGSTGLDLKADVLDWMGDFAVFVRGTSVAELDGALVVVTEDPAATKRFLERIRRLAAAQRDPGTRVGPLTVRGGGEGFTVTSTDVPQPVHVFVRDDRFVVAYGDAAAQDAVDPAETLGDSPAFSRAKESLDGFDVSFYLDLASVLQLVDSTPAGSDPGYQEAKPYLEPLKALVGGSEGSGGDMRTALKALVE